jgi:hypothetical protein
MVLMEGVELDSAVITRRIYTIFSKLLVELECLDKSWVDRNLTFWKCFQLSDEFVVHLNVNADKMFIISQADSRI